MIEKLKSRVTRFTQIRKINEIIDAIESLTLSTSNSATDNLVNEYRNRINQIKDWFMSTLKSGIDKILSEADTALANLYTKVEADNLYLNKNNRNDYLRYDNLNINGNLTINSIGAPAMSFNKISGPLFKSGAYTISIWPFSIYENGNKIFGIDDNGVESNIRSITNNTYRKHIRLPSWREANSSKENWTEAYAYMLNGRGDTSVAYYMIRNATKRSYDFELNTNNMNTDISCSFLHYWGGDKNHNMLTRFYQEPWGDRAFRIQMCYRKRRKHKSSYNHGWWDESWGTLFKCR